MTILAKLLGAMLGALGLALLLGAGVAWDNKHRGQSLADLAVAILLIAAGAYLAVS